MSNLRIAGALVLAGAMVIAVAAVAAIGPAGPGRSDPAGAPNGSAPPTAAATVPAAPGSLRPGVVAVVTESFSLVLDRTVVVGQWILVVDGPVDHGGEPAFLIQHWGDLGNGIRPDSDFGWLPASVADTALRPVSTSCPQGEPDIRDIAALQIFERPLCFGDRPLTLGPVTVSDVHIGALTSTRWISDDGRPDFFTGLPVSFAEPGLDPGDGAWLTVTGHFDDATSANCRSAVEVARCRQRFVVTAAVPADPPATVLRGAWRQTSVPPIGGRTGHVLLWSGSAMLVWGGTESSRTSTVFDGRHPRDGATYHPDSDTWQRIADAPIAGRDGPLAVWTGREMIVWGGYAGSEAVPDGAAYDPVADRWRTLPNAPLAESDAVGGWLAGRLVVVTSDGAAAYDPAENRWSGLPNAPIRPGWRNAAIAANRLAVIAFGDGAGGEVEAAVFDPATQAWTRIDVPLRPLDAGVGMVGAGRVVLVPTSGKSLDPVTGTWRAVATCPGVEAGSAWTGRYLLGIAAARDVRTGACFDLPPAPKRAKPFDDVNGREFPVAVWTGTEYITWSGGTGGDIVWVPNDGAVFRPTEPLGP